MANEMGRSLVKHYTVSSFVGLIQIRNGSLIALSRKDGLLDASEKQSSFDVRAIECEMQVCELRRKPSVLQCG
jgi:hypothetical protein